MHNQLDQRTENILLKRIGISTLMIFFYYALSAQMVVETGQLTVITDSSAVVSGTISASEDVLVSERGIVHAFAAYATNSAGTSYSAVQTFTTTNNPPFFTNRLFNASSARYAGEAEELVLEGLEESPRSFTFSKDGTKMFVPSRNGDDIPGVVTYTLANAFDVSSASSSGTFTELILNPDNRLFVTNLAFAFNENGTKMFVLNENFNFYYVTEYILNTAFDVASASHSSSFKLDESLRPTTMAFSEDGTKMFVLASPDEFSNPEIVSYMLTNAFDMSNVSNLASNWAEEGLFLEDFAFNEEGNKMLVLADEGFGTYGVTEYTLLTAFDLSVTEKRETSSVTEHDQKPVSMAFGQDGSKMFLLDESIPDHKIMEYVLDGSVTVQVEENTTEVIFDADALDEQGSEKDAGITYSLGGEDAALFTIASDGAIQFASTPDFEDPSDSDGDNQYHLIITADDGQSANNTSTLELVISIVDTEETTPLVFSGNYEFLSLNSVSLGSVVVNNGGEPITEKGVVYSSTITNDNPTIGGSGITKLAFPQGGSVPETGIFNFIVSDLSPDVSYSYVAYATNSLGTSYGEVKTFTLANRPPVFTNGAYDVSTANYSSEVILSDQESTQSGLAFNNSGTQLFMIDDYGQIVEYSLARPFDMLSTDSVKALELTTEYSYWDIVFNNDGSRMFALSDASVFEFSLSNPFDIATVHPVGSLDLDGESGFPGGLDFSQNGTKLFISVFDEFNGLVDILEYDLLTPFDLSSASLVQAHDLQDSFLSEDIAFNENGSKMFLLGEVSGDFLESEFADEGGEEGEIDTGLKVLGYDLSVPYDVSSAVLVREFSLSATEDFPVDLSFHSNGTRMFILTYYGIIQQYNLGASLSVDVEENVTGVIFDANATNGESSVVDFGVTYSLEGPDAASFIITDEGEVLFLSAPDHENPTDSDADNVYNLTIAADDGQAMNNTSTLELAITVSDLEDNLPVVTTDDETDNLRATSVSLFGRAEAGGGVEVSEKGFVYAETAINDLPRIGGEGVIKNDNITDEGEFFHVDLVNLNPATQYSYAAYAINSAGTSYGEVEVFTTFAPDIVTNLVVDEAVVDGDLNAETSWSQGFTTGPSDVTLKSVQGLVYLEDVAAPLGGEIRVTIRTSGALAEGEQIDDLGVQTVFAPVKDNVVTWFSETGPLLQANTTYYIHAIYASGGQTRLGASSMVADNENTGIIPANSTFRNGVLTEGFFANIAVQGVLSTDPPAVRSVEARSIRSTSAILGGDVTTTGIGPVTENGVVYSRTSDNANPQIGGVGVTQEEIGSGIEAFEKVINDLSVSTQYSFAAYAINDAGVSYGNVQTFTTNTAPVFTSTPIESINEGETYTYTIETTDVNGDHVMITASSLPGWLSLRTNEGVDISEHVVELTGESVGQFGNHDVVLLADDDKGGISEQSFTITVNDATAPVITSETAVSFIENSTMTVYTVTATDNNPDAQLTYSLGEGNDEALFDLTAEGVLTFKTAPDFENPLDADENNIYQVNVRASDGNNMTDQLVMITLINIDTAPSLTFIADQRGDEETEISFTAIATDEVVPESMISFRLDHASLGKGMTIDASTGAFSWIPNEMQDGTHEVRVMVSNSEMESSQLVTITILEVNVAPVLSAIGDQSGEQGQLLSFTAEATDADLPANTLTFSLDQSSIDKGMTIDASTGVFNWTPTEVQDGTHEVVVSVSDGVEIDSESIMITINALPLAIDPHNQLSIYPNPATMFVSVKGVGDFSEARIYSYSGQLVLFGQVKDQQIDISRLPAGMYIIKIFDVKKEVLFQSKISTID